MSKKNLTREQAFVAGTIVALCMRLIRAEAERLKIPGTSLAAEVARALPRMYATSMKLQKMLRRSKPSFLPRTSVR